MKFSPRFTPQINKNSIIVGFNLPQRESTMFALSLYSLFDIVECASAPTLRSLENMHVTAAERGVDEQAAVLK